MKRIHHRAAGVFAAVLIGAVLSGCNQAKASPGQNKGAAEAPAVPVFAVNTTLAVQGQILDYLALSGDIVSGTSVDTFSDAAGKITRVYVSVGDRVARNDPVAAVDPSRPGMTYQANIVRAPIAGTITALPAQVGMTISQAVPLARIAGGNALEIKLYVAERFISKIALRQPCQISLDAWPGDVFRGSVTEISPVVDAASRTMEVRVNVENPGAKLKAGMFAKVRIITEEKSNIVKIPNGAMLQRSGEDYVFTVATDPRDPAFRIARRQVITPGILVDGVLEVQQGLTPNQEIIIRGQTLLEDGSRINVIEQVAPLGAAN
ncbi:putative membrane fusion protein [Treponema primitia ZAS-2]|uniref:Putative membrane fusion protein n=1 Tax=Treponema primitia (strain ATCC BAA-887 / DSM 12427 / ZAS-2) TaxID=545694 RepID=F5YQQ8_TREPZ|nr:efflux RND transporter periplasmic adaptor subunit [Treponema primitia]AEF85508.1 putative membrane fusion protein [Treponema primitia ZAS-2]